MKKVKKIISSILIFITVLYFPMVVEATENERIINEAKIYLQNSTPIELNSLSRAGTDTFNKSIFRAANISIRRSSVNSGITLNITQNSDYNVAVCIFTSDAQTVIGETKYVYPDTFESLNWSAYELGDTRGVLVFITCYKDVTYRVWGSITY